MPDVYINFNVILKGIVQSSKSRSKTRCICSKGLFLEAGVGGSGLQTTGARWLRKWVVFGKLHQKMFPNIEKNKIWAKWLRPFCVHNWRSRRCPTALRPFGLAKCICALRDSPRKMQLTGETCPSRGEPRKLQLEIVVPRYNNQLKA